MKKLAFGTLYHFILLLTIVSFLRAQSPEVYGRFQYQGQTYYGQISGNHVSVLTKAPWKGGVATGKILEADQLKWLPPSEPHVIIGLAKSFASSWKGRTPPHTVRWFIKPPTAAVTSGDVVILPPTLNEVKVEGEMVIVIGKTVKNASENEAQKAIFGFTQGDDIVGTVRSYHQLTGDPPNFSEKVLATGLKICDRFAPYGPFIYRNVDCKHCQCRVQIVHSDSGKKEDCTYNTSGLLYSPAKIVSDLSRVLTLNPGDVIFTGTVKAFFAHPGDVITIKISNFKSLQNKIVGSK